MSHHKHIEDSVEELVDGASSVMVFLIPEEREVLVRRVCSLWDTILGPGWYKRIVGAKHRADVE